MIFRTSQRDPKSDVRFTTYGELAYQLPYSLTDKDLGIATPRALKLGLRQTHRDWEYGWDYRALESRFGKFAGSDLKKDEAGSELWGARKLGPLRLKGYLSQKWNNLGEDPNKDRTTTTVGGTALEFTLPASTWLTLSYGRGTSESSRDFLSPAGRRRLAEIPRATERSVETTTASLYHWSEKWDVSLSTSYSPSRDLGNPEGETVNLSHDLSASLHPNDKLWITPSLGFWESRERSAGSQTQGATASLSVFYGRFLEHYTFTLWGSYDWGRSSDGYWDAQTINASAQLSRRLGRTLLGDAWLSFELGNNLYLDALYSSSSYSEIYGRLLLRLLAF